MKKYVLIFVLMIVLSASLCSCGGVKVVSEEDVAPPSDNQSMFVRVEQTTSWTIVYHRETKVMYAVSWGAYNNGTFTLLVDTDGSPMLYGEEE